MRRSFTTGSITDVKGIKVGQVSDYTGITGITVVLCERGATGSCLIMGGAPGTRETDLLDPSNTVDRVHAVFLAGGSAFGLNAASGIVRYLEERNIGFETGVARVPIVAGAILFDLSIGDPRARPTPEMAYKACEEASEDRVASGNVGAGTGATVGKLLGPSFAMKSGIGNCSLKSKSGFTVGAMVAVNALGNVYHPETGELVAGCYDRKQKVFLKELSPWIGGSPAGSRGASSSPDVFGRGTYGTNTTIGVVAVDADLSKAECYRISMMAMGGLARCIRPSFSPFDGDAVFILATGAKNVSQGDRANVILEIGALAQECFSLAILDAVLSCESLGGVLGARDIVR